MYKMIVKSRNKKGFTLVELLIVLAIVAIMAAIAIPAYSAQMEKAREGVDKANLRAAKSMAVTEYLLDNPENTNNATYGFSLDPNSKDSLIIGNEASAAKIGKSDDYKNKALTVTVNSGKVTKTSWD